MVRALLRLTMTSTAIDGVRAGIFEGLLLTNVHLRHLEHKAGITHAISRTLLLGVLHPLLLGVLHP